jgi:hypothetical protein
MLFSCVLVFQLNQTLKEFEKVIHTALKAVQMKRKSVSSPLQYAYERHNYESLTYLVKSEVVKMMCLFKLSSMIMILNII